MAEDDAATAKAMAENGFLREDRSGLLNFGWYNPEHPVFGFQPVIGPLFDRRADTERTD